jgi:hypothetical protein
LFPRLLRYGRRMKLGDLVKARLEGWAEFHSPSRPR